MAIDEFEFKQPKQTKTSEKAMVANERGAEAAVGLSEEVLYKIEIPANRYDLLCMEGIVRALRFVAVAIPISISTPTLFQSGCVVHDVLRLVPNTASLTTGSSYLLKTHLNSKCCHHAKATKSP